MGGLRVWTVAMMLVALLPIRGHALDALQSESEEIGIDAQQLSFDQKNNAIVARGAVVITRGTMTLRADEVRVNRTTNEADASGNVSVTDPMGTIVAEEMHFNLDEETGLLLDAEVQSRRLHYSLWGTRIEKGVGQSYHIENGRFTTCKCAEGPPSWSISGKDVDVSMGGYATLRDGTFNILGRPVMYLPRALLPVQRDRQSGFLTPRFGISNQRGFQTLLPYYFAIDKSQDATVALDVETSKRIGLVNEYRYALSRGSTGVINVSYFNEFFRGTAETNGGQSTVPTNRWSVVSAQTQQVGDGLQAYTDMFLVSDDLFLREINTYAFDHPHEVAIRTLPFVTSHAGFLQLWDRAALKGEGTYYQNLTSFDPVTNQPVPGSLVGQTLQRAPVMSLWGQRTVGAGLLGDLNAVGVDYQRGSGTDGLRLDVQPGLTLPLPLGRSAFGSVRASVRETAYHLTDTTIVNSGGMTIPENQSRELLEVDGQVGTSLDRIYPVHFLGVEKLKHTIEPSIQYLYIPAVAQGDLPLFDGTDRVNRRNLVTYGLTSRFIGRFESDPDDGPAPSGGAVRELGRLSIMQSADITHEIDTLEPDRVPNHFSDIDLAARANPSRFFSADTAATYDPTKTSVSAMRVSLFVEDPRYARNEAPGEVQQRVDTRTSARVSYRVLTQNKLQEIDDHLVVRLTDWAGFLYASRYDVVQSRFLENFFGLRLLSTCDCWAFDLAVIDRTNPQEVEVRTQLTLVGIGSSKRNSRSAAQ
jgi:LPS-assembly protein